MGVYMSSTAYDIACACQPLQHPCMHTHTICTAEVTQLKEWYFITGLASKCTQQLHTVHYPTACRDMCML